MPARWQIPPNPNQTPRQDRAPRAASRPESRWRQRDALRAAECGPRVPASRVGRSRNAPRHRSARGPVNSTALLPERPHFHRRPDSGAWPGERLLARDDPASDRKTVLQLPEQSFYPAGTQIGGGKIDGGLIFQLGMGRGEKALGFLG